MSLASSHTRPSPSRALVTLLLVIAACGGDGNGNGSPDFTTMGMPGVPSPTRVGVNLVFAEVAVNGHPGGRLAVDTGSPLVLLDAAKFPGLMLGTALQVTGNLTVGTFTVDGIPIVQNATNSSMDPLNFAGLLGGNVMQQFPVRLDYANPDRALRLGMPAMEAPTDGVENPGTAVDFNLEGGGRGTFKNEIITLPATRIPLTVDVDGVAHPFILDTGASETTVRTSLFTAITADGRAQLGGLPITTVKGPAEATVTRVHTLGLAGATVVNPVVMTIGDDGEMLLDGIQAEVHHPIEGLLGGNFLREFMVTVDYPGHTLHLQRYTAATIVDEFKRVGFELASGAPSSAHQFAIGVVYLGTDAAAKQLSPGDEIVSIDGQALDPLDSITADTLLNGTVGTTKAVGLGLAHVAALSNTTVDVLVQDLVPAP
jgi:hypothetical protein